MAGAKKAEKPEAPAPEPEQAEPEQAEPEQPEPAEPEPDAAEPAGEVTVIVKVAITGTRNGEPWPAVGEPFVLPAAEAEQYILLGYAARSSE